MEIPSDLFKFLKPVGWRCPKCQDLFTRKAGHYCRCVVTTYDDIKATRERYVQIYQVRKNKKYVRKDKGIKKGPMKIGNAD